MIIHMMFCGAVVEYQLTSKQTYNQYHRTRCNDSVKLKSHNIPMLHTTRQNHHHLLLQEHLTVRGHLQYLLAIDV